MDNLKEVLRERFNKTPEEISDIMQRIHDSMDYEGHSVVEVLTEVFGEDVDTLLKILGESDA